MLLVLLVLPSMITHHGAAQENLKLENGSKYLLTEGDIRVVTASGQYTLLPLLRIFLVVLSPTRLYLKLDNY